MQSRINFLFCLTSALCIGLRKILQQSKYKTKKNGVSQESTYYFQIDIADSNMVKSQFCFFSRKLKTKNN